MFQMLLNATKTQMAPSLQSQYYVRHQIPHQVQHDEDFEKE
jgi:hypothetical protein